MWAHLRLIRYHQLTVEKACVFCSLLYKLHKGVRGLVFTVAAAFGEI